VPETNTIAPSGSKICEGETIDFNDLTGIVGSATYSAIGMTVSADSGAANVPSFDGSLLTTAVEVTPGDMGLVVADTKGAVVGGSIVFSFTPAATEFQTVTVCGATTNGSLTITEASGGTYVVDGVIMTGPEDCVVVSVGAAGATQVVVSTDGIVSDIGVCIDPDGGNNAPPPQCPPSEPELLGSVETDYPGLPIEIVSQDTSSVTFTVTNTFKETTTVFTQYHTGNYGEVECLQELSVNEGETVDTYTATCMHNVPVTIVNIWIASTVESGSVIIDNDEVPGCCYPDQWKQVPTVQFTLKIPCNDPCPDDDAARRLSKVEIIKVDDTNSSAAAFKGATSNAHEKAASEPSADGKDGHFCVADDYPCGENNTQVHVCHYSARDGYKTFCVPEPDSDVLAFYPKDYCGPCVGGYATK
jgi:hypothetical protein